MPDCKHCGEDVAPWLLEDGQCRDGCVRKTPSTPDASARTKRQHADKEGVELLRRALMNFVEMNGELQAGESLGVCQACYRAEPVEMSAGLRVRVEVFALAINSASGKRRMIRFAVHTYLDQSGALRHHEFFRAFATNKEDADEEILPS